MEPSSSSARGSSSRGRSAAAWVLLDRAPRAADHRDPTATGGEADVMLQLLAPPRVSTAFVGRALLPDPAAAAADDDAAQSRILGADSSGRLLFSLPPPRAPGDSHLAVCRPIPDKRGESAKGKAGAIPAFPEQQLGHALSEPAPTAILFDPEAEGGDGFFVAQTKSTPPVVAALFFSSDAVGWTVAEVPAEGRWSGFRATSVVSHDRDVRADSAAFVFVDLSRRGLLLFHPRRLAQARFIELPVPEGAEGQATVGSSDGRLVFVVFEEVDEGTLVRFWSLSEDESRWRSHCHLAGDEVFGCDSRLWPLRLHVPPVLGPIDPDIWTRVIFGDGRTTAFCFNVTPDEMGLLRVDPLALDSVVFRVPPPPKSSWTEAINSALEYGKRAGEMALDAAQKGRPYADNLPAFVQLVGTTWSIPYTATALTAATIIRNANNFFTVSEKLSSWFWKSQPGKPPSLSRTVGSLQEADEALKEWMDVGRPRHMTVEPAPEGLSQQVWTEICEFLKDHRAETLIQHHEWVMVGRPPVLLQQ